MLKLQNSDTDNFPHRHVTYSKSHLIPTRCLSSNTIKLFNSDYRATSKLPTDTRYLTGIAKHSTAPIPPDPHHTTLIAHTHIFKKFRTLI
jgi:hypothetical protein